MKPELLDYELLVKAKGLIDTPEKWLQLKGHNSTSYESATAFCSVGALRKITGSLDESIFELPAWGLLIAAASELVPEWWEKVPHGRLPMMLNDSFPHATTMKMWDLAIAKAEAKAR